MQAFYAANFEREMGCTEAQWLMWLPRALGEHPWHLQTDSAAVCIDAGTLDLTWQVAPARVIGLVSIPVLRVSFCFGGLDEAQRYSFMKRFDLYMQRGGG